MCSRPPSPLGGAFFLLLSNVIEVSPCHRDAASDVIHLISRSMYMAGAALIALLCRAEDWQSSWVLEPTSGGQVRCRALFIVPVILRPARCLCHRQGAVAA